MKLFEFANQYGARHEKTLSSMRVLFVALKDSRRSHERKIPEHCRRCSSCIVEEKHNVLKEMMWTSRGFATALLSN